MTPKCQTPEDSRNGLSTDLVVLDLDLIVLVLVLVLLATADIMCQLSQFK